MPPIGFETSGKCLPPKPHLNSPENWGTSHLPLREVEESPTAKWGHKKGKDEVSASKQNRNFQENGPEWETKNKP